MTMMTLGGVAAVARTVDPSAEVEGDETQSVAAVNLDSRTVEPGDLFACVRGATSDGHDFATTAVAAGAKALIVDRQANVGSTGLLPPVAEVPRLVVADVRRSLGPISSALWGEPSAALDVVGVTGTNGKTTTVHLVASVLAAADRRCETVGTLTGVRTTPEAPELQRKLASFVASGVDAVAMEVSSHALDQHRVDGTRFAVAAFTNLSPDHLDYHADMDAYFEAKARLFSPDLCQQAVVTTGDDAGRRLAAAVDVPVTTCSLADVSEVDITGEGSTFVWRGHRIRLGLHGEFNITNAVTAATIAQALGIDDAAIAGGLSAAGPVSGRFERVDSGQPFTVIVDFAHTPDGLRQVLDAASQLVMSGKVIVVFGCGGERDADKRPVMGRVAAESGADLVVTADNSRCEATADIIEAIVGGVSSVAGAEHRLDVVPDRRLAIRAAIGAAGNGDLVLIAGRGHESTLTIGDETLPFDDRVVATEELAARGWFQ